MALPTPSTIQKIAAAGVAAERKTGVPAELSCAQCALESGWLKSAPRNNAFGMKHRKRHKDKQLLTTKEWFFSTDAAFKWAAELPGREIIGFTGQVSKSGKKQYAVRDWFAAFASLEEAFLDHGWLISNGTPYKAAWQRYLQDKDWKVLADGVGKAYATVENYASHVVAALGRFGLGKAIEQERGATNV